MINEDAVEIEVPLDWDIKLTLKPDGSVIVRYGPFEEPDPSVITIPAGGLMIVSAEGNRISMEVRNFHNSVYKVFRR